jgi:DNA-binding NarL/FixJ family response regulator
MMRCGKFDISSLFSRRLKLWIYGGVSLILADFEMPMAHAAGYLTYSMSPAATLSAIKLIADGENFVPADILADENMMVGKGHLTGREHDVLSGLFAGSSNKEIARSLNLSEVTIKHHLKSLRSKLGAKNRTHAVCRAIELGIS